MSKRELLARELEGATDDVLEEVLDFVRFLKFKSAADKFETLTASESSLRKDWLRPEEDEAWAGL